MDEPVARTQPAPQQETAFAPAGRASETALAQSYRQCLEHPITRVILESVQGCVLLLNEERQVVAANDEVLEGLRRSGPVCAIGLRPGELLGCIHYVEGPDGCGTSRHCRSCGAVLAILASQVDRRAVEGECRMSMMRDGRRVAAEFRVRATPIDLGDRLLTAFVFNDISAAKRREVFEQAFLHDFSNALGAIEGWGSLLGEGHTADAARQIVALTTNIRDDLELHRTLLEAERNQLAVRNAPCDAPDLLNQLSTFFRFHRCAKDRGLQIHPPPAAARFVTDGRLLMRVLINMVRNALEATPPEGAVGVRFTWQNDRPAFHVHNAGVIDPVHQPHIFERAFTTKGAGRGLGTYSMKLFGETFLGGRVSFTSSEGQGTEFSMVLPALVARAGHASEGSRAPETATISPDEAAAQWILLVDDEDVHLRLSGLLLRRLGYAVRPFRDPAAALQALSDRPASFSAALVDYRMPGMDGLNLARRLHAIRPELPVVLCTGFDDPDVARSAREAGLRAVVRKPTSRERFAEVLRSAGLTPSPSR